MANKASNVSKAQDTETKKVVTKYDKKRQKREEEARKEARTKIVTRCVTLAVLACAIVAACVAIFVNVNKIYKQYIVVDGKNMNQIEFDFYYGITKNTNLNTTLYGTMTYGDYYSQYLNYDSSKKDSAQSYSTDSPDYTWYDYFANQTIDAIKEQKGLLAAADEEGYTFDKLDENYDEFISGLKDSASEADMSYKAYVKEIFGKHATPNNIKGYVKDYLKATEFQEHLTEKLKATDDEVKEYYENNKDSYDEITYRTYEIEANSSDTADMQEAKSRADEFIASVSNEETFAENCRVFAANDDVKNAYEKDEASLESNPKNDIESVCQEWLSSNERSEGDVTVIEDTTNACYYCLYYIKKEYDGSLDESIASLVLNEKYSDFIKVYTDKVKIDVKGRFSFDE